MDKVIWKRLSDKFVVAKSGCWEWNAAKNLTGYGKVWFIDMLWQAHRLAYVGTFGEVIEGKDIHHKCENLTCPQKLCHSG